MRRFRRRADPRRTLPTGGADTTPVHPIPGSDREEGVSWRMLLAAAMLRRGDDPTAVAAETGVPVALLELMRRETETPLGPVGAPLDPTRRQQTATAVLILGSLAIANVVACVTALLHHHIAFGVSSGVVAVATTAAIHLIGRGTQPASRSQHPSTRTPTRPGR